MSEDKKDDEQSKDEGDGLPPPDTDLDDSIIKALKDLKYSLKNLGVLEEFEKAMKDDLRKTKPFVEVDKTLVVDKALKHNLKKFGLDKYLKDVSGMTDKIDFKK